VVEDASGYLRMNIDKGNQAEEGEDMINLGNIANPNLDPETADGLTYALMDLDSEGQRFTVTSDGDGKLWIIAGTDSGFEGPTTVYYDRVERRLRFAQETTCKRAHSAQDIAPHQQKGLAKDCMMPRQIAI